MKAERKVRKILLERCLGGSAVKHLPSAQDVILESRDGVPHQAPCVVPASLSLMHNAHLVFYLKCKIEEEREKRKEALLNKKEVKPCWI